MAARIVQPAISLDFDDARAHLPADQVRAQEGNRAEPDIGEEMLEDALPIHAA
jgi:hypothetical protein